MEEMKETEIQVVFLTMSRSINVHHVSQPDTATTCELEGSIYVDAFYKYTPSYLPTKFAHWKCLWSIGHSTYRAGA